MVPVLSSTTVSTFANPSSAAPPFTRMPRRAATPVATMMAVGVASPSAHGHAMTSTAIALVNAIISASLRGLGASGNAAAPNTTHSTKVSTDAPRTTSVNHALTVSASRATGARSDCASSTIRTICCSTVSAPTLEARNTMAPLVLSVPAMMASPGRLATGMLSPVSIDWSNSEVPSSTVPSTGTRSPGRTTTRSPCTTCSTGTSTSEAPRRTRAIGGCSAARPRTASRVRMVARISSHRPTSTSVITTPAASK